MNGAWSYDQPPLQFLMMLFLVTVWSGLPAYRWSMTFCLGFLIGLDWPRPVLQDKYCFITAKKRSRIFCICLSIVLETEVSQHYARGSHSLGMLVQLFYSMNGRIQWLLIN